MVACFETVLFKFRCGSKIHVPVKLRMYFKIKTAFNVIIAQINCHFSINKYLLGTQITLISF